MQSFVVLKCNFVMILLRTEPINGDCISIFICLTVQYFDMPFKIKSCQQLRITIQFINYLTCEISFCMWICSSSCYNSGFNLLTYILSHWLHNCWFATITNQRDPLTGPPSHCPPPPSPISLIPFLLVPQLIGPQYFIVTHWSPISLVPHLTGPPTHRSPLSLVPQVAPMHHPFQWSPISLVPRLTGPPSHWSPIPLVPFSLVPKFISPPLHCLNALVILITGHPFH